MANNSAMKAFLQSEFMREYGMIFVLLLLVVLFSLLTFTTLHPKGEKAGRDVAQNILAGQVAAPNVLVVAGNTFGDKAFAGAVQKDLAAGGAPVLLVVNAEKPADVKSAIQTLVDEGKSIDAIAATQTASNWMVYQKVEGTPRITPTSSTISLFLTFSNLIGIANQTAIYAIIGIGMTMVIISTGIDLSVGSLIALSSMCASVFIRDIGGGDEASLLMMLVGCSLGIGVCAFSGSFVGVMVTGFRVPAFIVTLAVMLVARGVALRLGDGESINALPASISWLGAKDTLHIPNQVILMVVLYIIAHVVMSKTTFGRHIYAIGGNAEAARLSGIRVNRTLIAVYTSCGALAGLGGVILTSELDAGDPTLGEMYELEVIAAVVVGGTSLMGGQGRIFGTLIGAFIIAVIKNGMNMMNVRPFDQLIVLGAVLLLAVLLDTLKRRSLKT